MSEPKTIEEAIRDIIEEMVAAEILLEWVDLADAIRKHLAAPLATIRVALEKIVKRVEDATPLTGGPYTYRPVGRGSAEGNLLADVQEIAEPALAVLVYLVPDDSRKGE